MVNSEKQAILILAHQADDVLKTLIQQFDSTLFDIFIHFDRKFYTASLAQELQGLVRNTHLSIISTQSVTWAAPSVMRAELDLMNCAFHSGHYHYFHLLSGQDLAIKSADVIYDFFKSQDTQFFEIRAIDSPVAIDRVTYRYPLVESIGKKHNFFWVLQKAYLLCQKGLHIKNQQSFILENKLAYASQWASMTNEFVNALLLQKSELQTVYRQALVPDEIYKATFLVNNTQRFTYYNRNYRFISFMGNSPKMISTQQEVQELLQSENFFARKFAPENQLLKLVRQATIENEKIDGRRPYKKVCFHRNCQKSSII
ncbi:beta-1,6-N-acetylglucosaminyltransferase [Fructobacillus evanidus]|uniref:Peptide O-xylosyltransferase n=1 Tax=Fructobacillus evanidus TaxID=3064281 RepID=A0ABM9ML49_9LACO|nr:hypothetical protein R55250_KEHBDPNM_00303 [Fructobacillus sp. LMG 32999]CAK1223554.1 hypothetical protein R55203_MFJFHIJN_00002 [Fructobacillus sp. LMG 32999]CAK1223633.1 hypothetical protein R55214_HHFBAMCI_00003 [Fructobacillus sp. LMG 32999]CAK1231054.1 hypothetical protein R55234_GCHJJDIB_00303 [Fructobacillus sp. LMG 32999]CAK1254574.1 hypothetical protein R54837_OMAIDLJD_01574 [Fructobacillus sp. LMG 32999]